MIRNFLFLILSCQLVMAQQANVDSLSAKLSTAGNDIERTALYTALAEASKQAQPQQVGFYADKALQLAKKTGNRQAEAQALSLLGTAGIVSGNYREAASRFSQAISLFASLTGKDKKERAAIQSGIAKANAGLGIVFSEQSSYARALQYYFNAARIYEAQHDVASLARLYNNIGIAFQSQGEDFKALEYFLKCLEIQEQNQDLTAAITLTNIGNIYLHRGDSESAAQYYDKARAAYAIHPNPRGEGELYNNIGLNLVKKGQPQQAMASFEAAIRQFTSINDRFGVADTWFYLSELHLNENHLDQAEEAASKSLRLARETGVQEQIRNAEKILSAIYEKKGNPVKALEHYRRFTVAQDSLNDLESARNSVRAEMDFEMEKREALSKKESEKREIVFSEQKKRHRLEIIFVIVAAVLLSGLALAIYNRRQLRRTLTLQKELAEYERKALHLQMNPHFVFNCLGSISSFIVQNGTDSAIKYLSKFAKLMRLTLEYSKEALIPIDKEIESLSNYLELEQLRFNNKFGFTISKSAEIEDDMALPPLLLQPFVENAIIHGVIPKAGSGCISIHFGIEGNRLLCTITDDGIGIEKSRALKLGLVNVHKSMALDIIRKRLSMMPADDNHGASVDIAEMKDKNEEARGTKVTLMLPLQYLTSI